MRLPRAFALAFSLLVCYAIDMTRAMELLHNVQEGTESSRLHISSEAKLFDHSSMDHVACLQRRGLVAGRLKLMRRCQKPESQDFGPMGHDSDSERQTLLRSSSGKESPKGSLNDEKVDRGFETGIMRLRRTARATWEKLRKLFSTSWRKQEDARDGEKVVIAEGEKPQLDPKQKDAAPQKTLGQKIRSGFASGLKKSWKYLSSNWGENGVNTVTKTHAKLPSWGQSQYKKPWKEMEKSIAEMQAEIKTMNLPDLIRQMSGASSPEIVDMARNLANTEPEASEVVLWAMRALYNSPKPSEAMTDGLREKLVISVKTLYVHATALKESPERDLAREGLKLLNNKFQIDAAHADKGIAKYIHAAYTSSLDKAAEPKSEEEIRQVKAIRDQLVLTTSKDLADEFITSVKSEKMKDPKNSEDMINLAVESVKNIKENLPPNSETKWLQLEKNADWGIRTLFHYARSSYPTAYHNLQELWGSWLETQTYTLAGKIGKQLKAAHDLLMV